MRWRIGQSAPVGVQNILKSAGWYAPAKSNSNSNTNTNHNHKPYFCTSSALFANTANDVSYSRCLWLVRKPIAADRPMHYLAVPSSVQFRRQVQARRKRRSKERAARSARRTIRRTTTTTSTKCTKSSLQHWAKSCWRSATLKSNTTTPVSTIRWRQVSQQPFRCIAFWMLPTTLVVQVEQSIGCNVSNVHVCVPDQYLLN